MRFRPLFRSFLKFAIPFFLGLFVAIPLTFVAAFSDRIYSSLEKFSKILHAIETSYVEPVQEQKLIEGAIQGMIGTLDPYSSFWNSEVYREFTDDIVGRFGGVGVEVTLKDQLLTIIAPVEGSPADRAGIRPGDQIVKINGELTKGMSLGQVAEKMRGPLKSALVLSVQRSGWKEPRDFSLVREMVKVRSVKSELILDRYAYLRITTFQERTRDDLVDDIEMLKKKTGGLKGIILDLRNNPGGLLNVAIEVADLFIPDGVIISTKGRDQKIEYRRASGQARYKGIPIVILINRNSASASELLTGALQDHGFAYVVGTTSFGKASVQELIDFEDGTALRLTTAYYYTPKGRKIHGKGIVPDQIIEMTNQDSKEVFLETSESFPSESHPVFQVQDLQKNAAVEYLDKHSQ